MLQHKCMRYWPVDDDKICDAITVTLLKEDVYNDYTIRGFYLMKVHVNCIIHSDECKNI